MRLLLFIFFLSPLAILGQGLEDNSFDTEGKRHGKWVVYSQESKQMIFQGEYSHGKRNGKFFSYYSSGEVENENYFVDNVFEGTQKKYGLDGVLIWECDYVKGVKHGREKYYYESGGIKYVFQFNNGEMTGEQLSYDDDGNLLPFTVSKGKK